MSKLIKRCVSPIWVCPDEKDKRTWYQVPCGKCLACKYRKAFGWRNRLLMEFASNPVACFVTLTYSNDDVRSLKPKDLTDYLKRLRYHFGKPVRYFACGEYGSKTHRPHYHLILFGLSRYEYESLSNSKLKIIEKNGGSLICVDFLWPHGMFNIGYVSERSISYVAGYVCKGSPCPDGCVKPFRRMSRRPGLGLDYLLKNREEYLRLAPEFGLERYVEDKLFPVGTLERQARDEAKKKFFELQYHQLRLDCDRLGKRSVDQLLRESRWQDSVDLAALATMKGKL